jgi:hypothetical protein
MAGIDAHFPMTIELQLGPDWGTAVTTESVTAGDA